MRWESDCATLATLHECRSPRARSLKPGPQVNRESANGVPPRHNLTCNPSKAPNHHILKGRVYCGSSRHWFGIFSKVGADVLS